MRYNEQLKEIRTTKRITQSELAEKLGVSRSRISNVESGKRGITIDSLESMCKALDCTLIISIQKQAPGSAGK